MAVRPILVGIAVLLVATGCGVATVPATAPVRAVTMQAAPQQAVLRIDRATRWDNHPSTPARTEIRLIGRDGQKSVEIVVQTLNPKWAFYVPTLDRVTVNGTRVTDLRALTALHERLYNAETADKEAKWWSQQAATIVRFGAKVAQP